jgi:hypothetical protein
MASIFRDGVSKWLQKQDVHGTTSQKTVFFIATVKT